jgi:hypothetical protein
VKARSSPRSTYGKKAVTLSSSPEGSSGKPYRFPTLQAADSFLTDLMASFAYLGCEVART